MRRSRLTLTGLFLFGVAGLVFALTQGGEMVEAAPETAADADPHLIRKIPDIKRKPGKDPHASENACLTCHAGLETIRDDDSQMFHDILGVAEASGTNNRCVVCHGGNAEIRGQPDADRTSDAFKALTSEAHSGTAAYFESHPGPKAFYPDPGSPWVNKQACGACHEWEVRVQWQSLMMTEAGKIQGTVWGFGAFEKGKDPYGHRWANYDVKTLKGDDRVGTPTYLAYMEQLAAKEPQAFLEEMQEVPAAPNGDADVTADPSLAAFTYIRGECQRCHLAVGGKERHGDFRGMGCSACHMPYGNAGLYQGGDQSLKGGRPGRPLVHSIQAGVGAPVEVGDVSYSGIPVETCTTCHNRGRRIGVSFQGLMETAYSSPYQDDGAGSPQPKLHGKHYLKLHADLHATKGFTCQDCHTTLDAHSSGILIGSISGAVEIECSDCHGTPASFPWELPIGYMDEYEEQPQQGAPRGLAQDLPAFMAKGDYPDREDGYLLSARGNPLGNVVRAGNRVHVQLASGAVRELTPLKALEEEKRLSEEAHVAMVQIGKHMDEMECYACHATWAPQCYGCHVKVDYSQDARPYDWTAMGHAHLENGLSPEYSEAGESNRIQGEIKETRSYLRWEDPALGRNGEGRVAPVIPGCQTTVTVVNNDGEAVVANKIYRIPNVEGAGPEGQRAIDHAPLHPHTVQKRARTCESCHTDPKAVGYGIRGGAFWASPSKSYKVDLQTADGRIIPSGVLDQTAAIPDLAGDWSQFVSPEGKQVQTVGHHFRLSRPLNEAERQHVGREGVCLACHVELPTENLAVSFLHHMADATGQVPHSGDEHSLLIHKIVLLSAWVQLTLAIALPLMALLAFVWWRRRRKRKRGAVAS